MAGGGHRQVSVLQTYSLFSVYLHVIDVAEGITNMFLHSTRATNLIALETILLLE